MVRAAAIAPRPIARVPVKPTSLPFFLLEGLNNQEPRQLGGVRPWGKRRPCSERMATRKLPGNQTN
jgi:hypothetical protein